MLMPPWPPSRVQGQDFEEVESVLEMCGKAILLWACAHVPAMCVSALGPPRIASGGYGAIIHGCWGRKAGCPLCSGMHSALQPPLPRVQLVGLRYY